MFYNTPWPTYLSPCFGRYYPNYQIKERNQDKQVGSLKIALCEGLNVSGPSSVEQSNDFRNS